MTEAYYPRVSYTENQEQYSRVHQIIPDHSDPRRRYWRSPGVSRYDVEVDLESKFPYQGEKLLLPDVSSLRTASRGQQRHGAIPRAGPGLQGPWRGCVGRDFSPADAPAGVGRRRRQAFRVAFQAVAKAVQIPPSHCCRERLSGIEGWKLLRLGRVRQSGESVDEQRTW